MISAAGHNMRRAASGGPKPPLIGIPGPLQQHQLQIAQSPGIPLADPLQALQQCDEEQSQPAVQSHDLDRSQLPGAQRVPSLQSCLHAVEAESEHQRQIEPLPQLQTQDLLSSTQREAAQVKPELQARGAGGAAAVDVDAGASQPNLSHAPDIHYIDASDPTTGQQVSEQPMLQQEAHQIAPTGAQQGCLFEIVQTSASADEVARMASSHDSRAKSRQTLFSQRSRKTDMTRQAIGQHHSLKKPRQAAPHKSVRRSVRISAKAAA